MMKKLLKSINQGEIEGGDCITVKLKQVLVAVVRRDGRGA